MMAKRESAAELRARLQRTTAHPQHIEVVTDTEGPGTSSELQDSRNQESFESRTVEFADPRETIGIDPNRGKVSVGTQMYAARKRQLAMEHALTGEPEWK